MKRGTDKRLKFERLQHDLDLRRWECKGLLRELWDFTALNAPTGAIGKFSNEDIAFGIDWQADPDTLIQALVDRGWVDEHPDHRLVVHDWPDHCEDSVHAQLARARQRFATGETPKLTKLRKDERDAIQAFFDDPAADGGRRRQTAADGGFIPPARSEADALAVSLAEARSDPDRITVDVSNLRQTPDEARSKWVSEVCALGADEKPDYWQGVYDRAARAGRLEEIHGVLWHAQKNNLGAAYMNKHCAEALARGP